MEHAYQPEAWRELYLMLGGAAAALAGLLFVATSIHLNDILKVPFLRIFARNNTIAMMALVVKAAVVLIPQKPILLAGEIFLIHIFGLTMAISVLIRHSRDTPLGRKVRASAMGLVSLLGILSALSLISQFGGGMYIVTLTYLIFLCLVVSSSWVLLTNVYRVEQDAKRQKRARRN